MWLLVWIVLGRCILCGSHSNRQTLLIFTACWNLVAGTRYGFGESTEWVVTLRCDGGLSLTDVVGVVEVGNVAGSVSGHRSWTGSVALTAGRWGLVRAIIETENGCVVLSEDTDWPGVDVVGITAALASESAFQITAVGQGHTVDLLLGCQTDRGLGDDAGGCAELDFGTVGGGRALSRWQWWRCRIVGTIRSDNAGVIVGWSWDWL